VNVTGQATADAARVLLAAAWGVLLATPLLMRARRTRVSGRLVTADPAFGAPVTAVADTSPGAVLALRRRAARALGPLTRVLRALHDRRRVRASERALQRELPAVLDLLGVAVGAGCTPYQAVEVAARWAPPAVGVRFDSVMRDCRLGASFDAALARAVRDAPLLRPVADALFASDRLGAPVAPALNRLAAEERTALRRRADAHARRVPVRLLFPLVFLVLPAFVLLTLVPGLASGLSRL
jgi:Flp pilus assembly protein TadB